MKTLVGLILGVALLAGGGAALAFDATSLKKLKALNACEGCDLSGADLSISLHEAKLSGADLSKAKLKGANLEGAKLCKTKMPWGLDNSGCK